MRIFVYSIFDSKAELFMAPQLDQNDETAKRGFDHMISNEVKGIMHFAPGDFQLYRIGEFNNKSGAMIPLVPIVLVANGSEVIE